MNKAVGYAFLGLVFAGAQSNLGAKEVPVAAGNLLQCTLDEPNLSSRTVKVGDPIVCYARPLREFGCSVFPRGAQLSGRFAEYRDPGRFIGKGWIRLEFDRLILPEGVAPISARLVSVHGFHVDVDGKILGRGHRKRDAAEWAIPVLWPEKILTLPLRGPRPTLKGERVLTLRLLDDVRLPCANFGSSWMESAWRFLQDEDLDWHESAWHPFKKVELKPFESFKSIIPFDSSLEHTTHAAGDDSAASSSRPRGEEASAMLPEQVQASRNGQSSRIGWGFPETRIRPKPAPRSPAGVFFPRGTESNTQH